MGIAHRTAARIVSRGQTFGKTNGAAGDGHARRHRPGDDLVAERHGHRFGPGHVVVRHRPQGQQQPGRRLSRQHRPITSTTRASSTSASCCGAPAAAASTSASSRPPRSSTPRRPATPCTPRFATPTTASPRGSSTSAPPTASPVLLGGGATYFTPPAKPAARARTAAIWCRRSRGDGYDVLRTAHRREGAARRRAAEGAARAVPSAPHVGGLRQGGRRPLQRRAGARAQPATCATSRCSTR